jgi:DNA-binding MarR family transcriptional regulator
MSRRQDGKKHAALEIADRLHSAAIHLLRRLRVEDERSGLSGPQLSALSVIVFGGPVTIGDLAAAEQVRPPTISRLVKELERRHLVTRHPDPRDGRVQRLRATAEGRRLLQEGKNRRVARLAEQIASLPAPQQRALERAAEIVERVSRPPAADSQ